MKRAVEVASVEPESSSECPRRCAAGSSSGKHIFTSYGSNNSSSNNNLRKNNKQKSWWHLKPHTRASSSSSTLLQQRAKMLKCWCVCVRAHYWQHCVKKKAIHCFVLLGISCGERKGGVGESYRLDSVTWYLAQRRLSLTCCKNEPRSKIHKNKKKTFKRKQKQPKVS